ncbi:hypothetical protein CR983_04215 [Candidatus Saccharibacteria bacterium]|nr:MAG: hypothetical protein CR983_04215 [Candidatus Saccharibacteria bacterium]
MLDDRNVINKRDSAQTLKSVSLLCDQLHQPIELHDHAYDGREIRNILVVAVGDGYVASSYVQHLVGGWLGVPYASWQSSELPGYAWQHTLVIVIEPDATDPGVQTCLAQASERGCMLVSIRHSDQAPGDEINAARIRLARHGHESLTVARLRAVLRALNSYGLIDDALYDESTALGGWLREQSAHWPSGVPIHENYAKQLALIGIGRTPVWYGTYLTLPAALDWKHRWNTRAKNIAFASSYPDATHSDAAGWSSHPVEKPYAVFEFVSELESPLNAAHLAANARTLSGRRPHATTLYLAGDTLLAQYLWAIILGEYVSIYAGIINNVKPESDEVTQAIVSQLH